MMQIDVQDLVFSYGGADVLQGVSFCADKGERIAVLGPNGVGKSTLFRCLLGFLEPKRGCVKIAGRDVQAYSRRALAAELAYIPQSYHPVFDHTVLESVLMGLSAQLGRCLGVRRRGNTHQRDGQHARKHASKQRPRSAFYG